MRCSKVVQQLQLYLDHQLSIDQVRELEAHLSTCPTCQEELFLLEEVVDALRTVKPVVEPAHLTTHIMLRVAMLPQRKKEERSYRLLHISLVESLLAIMLATFTTLVVIIGQPHLRNSLPFANEHATLFLALMNNLHQLFSNSNETTLLILWIVGTILGVWITWMAAGSEMRATWSKAMLDRLPVW